MNYELLFLFSKALRIISLTDLGSTPARLFANASSSRAVSNDLGKEKLVLTIESSTLILPYGLSTSCSTNFSVSFSVILLLFNAIKHLIN
uniref:Uncharacterized protein n=4 Tax=Pasteurellaceae TaxID=712 RepID=Q4W2S8_9PAST|nr:hypothetical protein [Actinobacillus pleuropneumoniae]AFP55525.1 hypothetical protein pFZ51_p08 [Glaesserella parasuis]AFV53157.1 hypothetical protein pov2012_p5 [Pasteurella multocida]CAH25825.1 hypothetical protein [Actinobacillus porcitonsillarum]AXF95001.1 hypothetical protein [Actinobacillus pleuropneumoniae]